MGYNYYGDIEGKLWFSMQNSNNSSFFGVDYKKIYNKKCGCFFCEIDDCSCEPEHIHMFETDEGYSKIICPSAFDEDNYDSIEYTFNESDIPNVKKGIETCFEVMEKLETPKKCSSLDVSYPKECNSLDVKHPNIRKILEIDIDKIHIFLTDILKNTNKEFKEFTHIAEWCARLELGIKILACLENKGSCRFTCELYIF
jgi:hypothetical protein